MINRFHFSAAAWRSTAAAMTAALVLAGAAAAQTSASASKNAVPQGGYSLLDLTIFGGYQWFQFGQGTNAAAHQFNGSGVWGERLAEEPWNYIGIEEGIQIGYNKLAFRPYGAPSMSTAPAGNTEIYAAGVIHLTPRTAKYRPFFLIGPEYAFFKPPNFGSAVIAPGTPPVLFPAGAPKEQGRTALAYGIGLKINESPKWAVRFDLRGMRSGSPTYGIPTIPTTAGQVYLPGGYVHESSLTASVGVTFRFRYYAPPAPVVERPVDHPSTKVAITAGAISGARTVCAGDTVTLTASASGAQTITHSLPGMSPENSAVPVTYQWMVNGSAVGGATGSSFSVNTTDGTASKSVTVQVSAAGADPVTSGAVTVTINPLTPPTIRFGISPSTVPYGTRVTLAATAQGSACGGPATIRYSGQGVSGTTFDSTALSFDQANRLRQQSQTVTITATATDTKNQTASATAPVTVTLTPMARRLDDIVFPQNSSRVNNCAKRVLLEELTPMLRNDPGAKVILIGHKDKSERGKTIDEERVLNALAVLSAGKGICPSLDLSRAMVNWVGTDQNDETRPAMCGSSTNVKEKGGQGVKESDKNAPFRRVEIWIVPSGADMPSNLTGLKAAPEKEVKAKGCPK